MKVLFIDHYDSFSFNLIDWLTASSEHIEIIRVPFDDPKLLLQYSRHNMPVVLSPGPKGAEDVPQTLSFLTDKLGHVPILGVCLGHQILGKLLGGQVVRSTQAFHGSSRIIKISDGARVFGPGTVKGASYNSLVLERTSLPKSIVVGLNNFGEVEMIEAKVSGRWVIGVQFHPESFLSQGMEPLGDFWTSEVKRFYS